MSIRLYHQVGHNPIWNEESFAKDNCGDGLILSPVHQNKTQIEKMSAKIRRVSMFDPQYYLPNSQKKKLHSYPFFPETLSGGFSTTNFAALALESAKLCLQFQITQQFEKIIVPARYFGQMDPEYAEKQEAYSVAPFLKAAGRMSLKKPLYLTLPLTSHMLESEKYRTGLLNWVTSFPELSGVYVFAANERETKQSKSKQFLSAYLSFLRELRMVDLDIQVGYLNTEALLLTLVGDISLSFGTFENTRIFSIDKFVVSSEERRGPKARMYVPALLNWIQIGEAKQIQANAKDLWRRIYEKNAYGDLALAAVVEPTFNQPPLYKHHFLCFDRQIAILRPLDVKSRYKQLRTWILEAIALHKELRSRSIELERHGNDEHLSVWLEVIDDFASAL